MHSHGQTVRDAFYLRYFTFKRCVDMIVYPANHDQVENIVKLANQHNVVIVPYGAGTNVTLALELDPAEKRMIVSLDTSRMNKIKWIDQENMLACVESGIVGIDLE